MKKCIICNNNLQGNQVKYCCGACKAKGHWEHKKNQPNTYHSQTKRALTRKLKYIEMLGGGCSVCGYNKNIAALDFHHLDVNKKNFNIDGRKISNTKEEFLLEELSKCVLLCANCHREEHYREMDLNTLKSKLK